MNLDRVTITGADNSVAVARLTELSEEFPFVEWGVLFSIKNCGSPRYPSAKWLEHLCIAADCYPAMKFALHICGQSVRSLFVDPLPRAFLPKEMTAMFQRIQLNFPHDCDRSEKGISQLAKNLVTWTKAEPGKEFIFQVKGDVGLLGEAYGYEEDFRGDVLFDMSGGRGVTPAEWPGPYYMLDDERYGYHGYAGGLGPDNLEVELRRIDAVANCRVWVDMESGVRSESDHVFDLAKVRQCLEIARPFVSELRRDARVNS